MSDFVGFIVGGALVVIGIVTGNPLLIIQGGAMIVSNAILLLTAPKQPARQASEMSVALGEQPRCMMVGEAFTPGSLVDGFNYGGKYDTDWEVLVIRLADHKCAALTGFYVNDEYVAYAGNGNYPQFDGNHFELYFRADTTTEPLPAVITANAPGWTAADIGESGCDVTVCYRADLPDAKNPAWPGGRPRFGFVLKGKLCYDPRLDDTVAGGSGAHRWDDPATWEYSENPVVCRYNWVRGVYANDDVADPTALLIGRGLSAEEAPPENVAAAANLCGEEIGEEAFLYESYATDGQQPNRLWGFTFSSDFSRFVFGHSHFEVWHTASRARLYSGTFPVSLHLQSTYGMKADGSFLAVDDLSFSGPQSLYSIAADGASAAAISSFPLADYQEGVRVIASEGTEHWMTVPYSSNLTFYLDGVAKTMAALTGDAWKPNFYFPDDLGNIWAVGRIVSAAATVARFYRVVTVSAEGPDYITVPGLPAIGEALGRVAGCYRGGALVLAWDGGGAMYRIDPADGTILSSRDDLVFDLYNFEKQFANIAPWEDSVWINDTFTAREISLSDLSTVQIVDLPDWLAEDADGVIFDPINNALITAPQLDEMLTWRFLANPVRYRVAGPIYSNQDFIDVEGMFAAATGGTVVTREGSVELEPGAAKSVVASFTDADLVSGSRVSWNRRFLSEADPEWINTAVANYVEPEQKWNSHNTPPQRDTGDILADGKPREVQIPLRLVRDLSQAQRIAEIHRRMGRLWGRGTVTLPPRLCELEDGDWVEWQSDRHFGGATITFRADAYQVNEKWQNTLTLREIAASVFADGLTFDPDLSEVPPPVIPPAVGAPDAGNWTLSWTSLESEHAIVPALVVEGSASDDDYVSQIIVEYWADDGVGDPVLDPDGIPWSMAGSYAPATTRVEIAGVSNGTTYYAAVSYVVDGESGDRLVLGPVTTLGSGDPWLHLEDGTTALHLEDDATVFNLG